MGGHQPKFCYNLPREMDLPAFEPAYLELLRSGELVERVREAYRGLEKCRLCARECAVNRRAGELGACRTGERALVSSYAPHFGEEAPLVGRGGSGTVFFTHCNLRCQFCQNYDISQLGTGWEVELEELAQMMLHLQERGCHNINFVSPSHVVPQILAGVLIAAKAGLHIPLVYNTGGYDSLGTLKLLDGVFDIYMPDMKYADETIARKFSGIGDYPRANQAAVKEMHRQVGDLVLDEQGIARRGLLVRHLVLPQGLAGTEDIVRFLAEEISVHTYLNLMDQYRPSFQADRYPELNRRITVQEFSQALELAHAAGLNRLDKPRARGLWLVFRER